MRCQNCDATESKEWHSYEYEEDDAYGLACSEIGVPTTHINTCSICDECFYTSEDDIISIEEIDSLLHSAHFLRSDLASLYRDEE